MEPVTLLIAATSTLLILLLGTTLYFTLDRSTVAVKYFDKFSFCCLNFLGAVVIIMAAFQIYRAIH